MKLKTKLLMITLLPIVILTIAVVAVTAIKAEEAIVHEIEFELDSIAVSLRDAIEMTADGDYTLDYEGHLRKGDFDVAEYQGWMDELREEVGIYLTIFYKDTRILTGVLDDNGNYIVGTKASDTVISKVYYGGNTYTAQNVDVNGEPFFAYYIPIFNEGSEQAVGMIFAGRPQQGVEDEIRGIILVIAGISAVIFAISIVVLLIIVSKLTKGLKTSISALNEVAQGNLTVSVSEKDKKRKDEIGDIGRATAGLIDGLVGIVGAIRTQSASLNEASIVLSQTAEETASVVEQVEKAVQDIASGATSQADETQQATSNVIVMGNMIEETNEEAKQLNERAQDMLNKGKQANAILDSLKGISVQSGESLEAVYKQTMTTNDSAIKIKEAIDLITAIAEETNLLSLNASIEAARAGDAGRGFAVVATQIQKLAEQSNESALTIDQIINELLNDSAQAVEIMKELKEIIEKQNEHVAETGAIFAEVMDGIDSSIVGVGNIREKSAELDGARTGVVDIVQNLSAIAEENAASTEETSASTAEVASIVGEVADSAKQLSQIAEHLENEISVFRV